MSFKRHGQLTKSPERIKHLGDFLSRIFWKRERKAEKALIKKEIAGMSNDAGQPVNKDSTGSSASLH